eukprot:13623551-Heterocapsa_arctica.AAC.1
MEASARGSCLRGCRIMISTTESASGKPASRGKRARSRSRRRPGRGSRPTSRPGTRQDLRAQSTKQRLYPSSGNQAFEEAIQESQECRNQAGA